MDTGSDTGLTRITPRGVELLDEEGECVARLDATEALALADSINAQRSTLEAEEERRAWRDRVEKLVAHVMRAGVTPPRRINVETGYEPTAELMWYDVGAVEVIAEMLGEPLTARLRWPDSTEHANSVTFFLVVDGVEFYAWEDDADLAGALANDVELVNA